MTFESINVPGLSDSETAILNRLGDALDKKARRNELRTAFYESKVVTRQVGVTIPEQYMRLAMVLGWPAKGVDALCRRSHLSGLTWPDGDIDSLGVEELADSNFLFSELSNARTDSCIHGVSYLITTQGLADEPRALVHSKSALDAMGDWNNRTRRLDNLLSITSRDDRKVTGFVLYLDGLTIPADYVDGKWVAGERTAHPWGVPADPLVYRPRTSRGLGASRITRPVMSLTRAAMRSAVRLEAHMDIYAIAKLIILGGDDSIFRNADGTAKESSRLVMGRILGIPDDLEAENQRADIKQLSAESPEPHLAHLNALAKQVARELSLPDSSLAITDVSNPTSAESYDASQHELIAEAEGANDDWSTPLRRTVTRALAIQNGENTIPAAWSSINTRWRNPRFLSRAAEADAGAKQLGAVPWLADTELGLELLGLTDDQIKRAMADRRRAAGRAVVAALGQVQPRAIAG